MELETKAAMARQRKLKRIAVIFFVLAAVGVLAPVSLGLFRSCVWFLGAPAPAAMVVLGVIIWTRSDPIYARTRDS